MSFNSSRKRSNNPTVGNFSMNKQAYLLRQRGLLCAQSDYLKYSWFLFLVQGYFVAFYHGSAYTAPWERRVLCAAGVSLSFLVASCHLSQEGVRGQCSLWSMARVLHFALLLSFLFLSLFTLPLPSPDGGRGSALENFGKT